MVQCVESTPTIPPAYIRVCTVVWECGEEQTDRHTDGRDQHTFRLDMPHAKRKKTGKKTAYRL